MGNVNNVPTEHCISHICQSIRARLKKSKFKWEFMVLLLIKKSH